MYAAKQGRFEGSEGQGEDRAVLLVVFKSTTPILLNQARMDSIS